VEFAPQEVAILVVNVGHPIVTSGDLLRSCVNVSEAIELPFGLVSEIDPGLVC